MQPPTAARTDVIAGPVPSASGLAFAMQASLAKSTSGSYAARGIDLPPVEPLLTRSERAALEASQWLRPLAATLRHEILRKCEVRSLRSGADVYGDEAPGLCGIASGAVCVRLEGAASHVLDYLPAGTWLLDPSVLADASPLLRIEVHRRATVARLPRAAVRELLRRHPQAASALQALGCSGVRRVTDILQELAALPLRTRLSRCVLRLADNFGVADDDGIRIALAINQDAIAHMLHASRQRVNIELKSLEAAGLLRVERELVVLDRTALACASAQADGA